MKPDELAFANEQLAGMLKSGLPLEGSLRELTTSMKRGSLRTELEALERDLAQGTALPKALDKRDLPPLYIRMLKVGVKGGNLPEVLQCMADHYRRESTIWIRLKSLMVYPLLVLVVAIAFAFGMNWLSGNIFEGLKGVWPRDTTSLQKTLRAADKVARDAEANAKKIAADANKKKKEKKAAAKVAAEKRKLAEATKKALAKAPPMADPRGESWAILMLWVPRIFLALIAFMVLAVWALPGWRHNLRWQLPAFHEAALSQVAASIAMLLRGGCPLDETLGLVCELEGNSPGGVGLREWSDRLARGQGKPAEFARSGVVFPPLFTWVLNSSGEDLAEGFERAAEIYHARAMNRVDISLTYFWPLSILTMGCVVGSQVITNFLPIAKMMDILGSQ